MDQETGGRLKTENPLVQVQNLGYECEFHSYAALDPDSLLTIVRDPQTHHFIYSLISHRLRHWAFNRSASLPYSDHPKCALDPLLLARQISQTCDEGSWDERETLMADVEALTTEFKERLPNGIEVAPIASANQMFDFLTAIYPVEQTALLSDLAEILTAPISSALFEFFTKGSKIIACSSLFVYPERQAGWMGWAMVHPEERGKGLHSQMIKRRVLKARTLGLKSLFTEVSPDSRSKQNLVEIGFSSIGVTRYQFLLD